ncbi:MAG: hypothetical protein D6715_02570 [Calditrichaeota bacterium]|nr:MAG: hypothetical protein D6715_02570 [Calditrichota bacterium]
MYWPFPLYGSRRRWPQAELRPASLQERFIAQLIDGLLLGVVCGLLVFLLSRGRLWSVWISPMIPQYLLEALPGHLPQPSAFWWGGFYYPLYLPYGKLIRIAYPAPLLYLLYWCYYGYFTARFGQTPGKIVKGLVVLSARGEPVSRRQAILRGPAYLISLLPLGMGIFWALLKRDGLTFHDALTGTRVFCYR